MRWAPCTGTPGHRLSEILIEVTKVILFINRNNNALPFELLGDPPCYNELFFVEAS